MYSGWFQVAFEREIEGELTPVEIGGIPLVLVRSEASIRAFDAVCPHRGAHLAYGGRLDGGDIICPFHGRRIRLGLGGEDPYCTKEYPVLGYGGLIFVRIGESTDTALEDLLEDLSRQWLFVPGFTLRADVRHELVIENAFDSTHFRPIHSILNEPTFRLVPGRNGEFAVEGIFELPSSPWQRSGSGDRSVCVPFAARAFSPGLVVSQMGGEDPYCVITGATPSANEGCTIRLSLAVPSGPNARPPDLKLCEYLLQQSRAGLEQDALIWRHMSQRPAAHYAPEDRPVIEFRRFCRRFAIAEDSR